MLLALWSRTTIVSYTHAHYAIMSVRKLRIYVYRAQLDGSFY